MPKGNGFLTATGGGHGDRRCPLGAAQERVEGALVECQVEGGGREAVPQLQHVDHLREFLTKIMVR